MNNRTRSYKYSRHARLRMVERGISEREVSDAVRKGRKVTRDGEIRSILRHLEVVLRKVGDDWYVITVMLRW
ncbi:MAG: DUF4258 domain-containing protein [Methanobacteriota archaeon]